MKNVYEMFKKETTNWNQQNIDFFGVSCHNWSEMSLKDIQDALDQEAENNWNSEKPCEMAALVLSGDICRNSDQIVKGSFELKQNTLSECIEISADFGENNKPSKRLIAVIPSPCPDLTWIISKINYTPRISCSRDYNMVSSDGETIRHGYNWTYNIKEEKFEIKTKDIKTKNEVTKEIVSREYKPYENLTERSICLLEACLGEKLTEENFEEGLKKLPVFDKDSIFNYEFKHIDMFFDIIRSKTKFANPLKNIHLAVNLIFMKQSDTFNESTKLVISPSPIFSLENFRTIVYKYTTNSKGPKKVSFAPSFTFSDTQNFFDAFKTSTSKDAGRHRLLLDNISIHDNMLFVSDKNGIEHNMFELLFNDGIQTTNISIISSSAFCNNNDPKRIMMTAKLSAQSVTVDGQKDEFTNRVPARVVFGDFKGLTYADAIIISESFAKKLRSTSIFNAECSLKDNEGKVIAKKIEKGDMTLDINDLKYLFPNKNEIILKGYTNTVIENFEPLSTFRIRLMIKSEILFLTGDKVTNLHGAKGVVGKILPDDEMPALKNDIGDFKAGPFEVIFSGFSVFRRGSLGQLFEAWANATGIEFEKGEDFAKLAIQKYSNEMKDFSSQSIVTLNGNDTIKPCGVIDVIRLYHHATTKVSQSYIKTNSNKMLKLGEQEKLNLVTNECTKALKELSIRSTHKHDNAFWSIYSMMKTRKLPVSTQLSSNFARMLKSMGFNFEVEGETLVKSDRNVPEGYEEKVDLAISEVSSNELLDLEKLFKELGLTKEEKGEEN